ncbi:MAG: hypothetical protein LUE29_05290 [Lachnospiraceae bacterium]|nr:hypothetical protein [Lachnospiraceae bacterium]
MNKKEFKEKMEKLRFAKEQISPSDEMLEQWSKLQDGESGIAGARASDGEKGLFLRIASMAAALALVVTAVAVTGYLVSRNGGNSDSEINGSIEGINAGTAVVDGASDGVSDGATEGTLDDTSDGASDDTDTLDVTFGQSAETSDGENEGEEDPGDATEGKNFGVADSEADGSTGMTELISGYGDGNNYLDLTSGDFAIVSGYAVCSDALRDAMEAYGDTVLYRVVVCLFENGVATGNGRAEANRLEEEGYTVAYETFTDGNGVSTEWLTIHATLEQIEKFAVSDAYGYMLCLYEEVVGCDS